MAFFSDAYKNARIIIGALCFVASSSCTSVEEFEPTREFTPTPVELRPKIVLQSLPTKGIEVAAWTADSEYIVTAVGSTRSIAIWEVASGNIVDRIRMPAEDGRTGALLRLSGMEVSPDANTIAIEGVSALYVAEGEYTDPRAMRYELDLEERTVDIARSMPDPSIDLERDNFEAAADALEAVFENDDELFDAPEDAIPGLPTLPQSPDGLWAMARLPVPSDLEDGEIPSGGLVLTNVVDGSRRELRHQPMQKYDAATLSPTGRWLAMTNDKMVDDEETGLEQSIIEIYDIQTATFEPQVKIIGDYSDIHWLSDDHFVVTETSDANDVMRDGTPDRGPAPDAIVIKAQGGEIEDRVEPRCYMVAVADGGFVGAGQQICRAFPQGGWGLQKYEAQSRQWGSFGPSELADSRAIDLIESSFDGSLLAVTEAKYLETGDFALIGHILDAATGELLFSRTFDDLAYTEMITFSADGNDVFVSGNGQIFRWQLAADDWGPMEISTLDTTVLNEQGDLFVTAGEADDAIGLLNFDSGELLPSLEFGNVSSGGFFPDKPLFWAFSAEEGLRLWDTRDWSIVLTTYFFDDQGFLAVTPDGRYDSNVHPYDARFRWLVPDQPFVSLNPDAFSRDYYTPGLTERWIDCSVEGDCSTSFDPTRPIAYLNRELPEVEIVDVQPGDEPDEAIVTVEFRRDLASDPDDVEAPWAFDPRVFRNHQLVYRQDSSEGNQQTSLSGWRSANAIRSESIDANGTVRLTSTVSLGTSDDDSDTAPVFTAYVFNEDRIKSETASFRFERPDVEPRTPRAYVLTIGIDHYQEARLNLNFAGNDAALMAESLNQIPGYETRTLAVRTSGASASPGQSEQRAAFAANQPEFIDPSVFRDLTQILSAEDASEARARLAGVGIDTSMLEQATPDDLVIISYAGHGWTDETDEFFIVTSNAVWSDGDDTPDTESLVSSVQLANWMSSIDAGTMALVIDACHSAASVENGTFKPGPLGDPGLGQLAFDKGVLILTATQADDVAVEDANLNHGLLTYALAAEGINAGGGMADLDGDGQILLTEWLTYAVERLPDMQSDPRVAGLTERTLVFHDQPEGLSNKRVQEPSLFNFNVIPRRTMLRSLDP